MGKQLQKLKSGCRELLLEVKGLCCGVLNKRGVELRQTDNLVVR